MSKEGMIQSIHSVVTFDMSQEEKVTFEKLLQNYERNSGRKTVSSQNGERQHDCTKIHEHS